MFTAKIQNRYGEMIELTHNPDYTVKGITGLNPVNASINTGVLATTDGAIFNSSRKGQRNIVILVAINGDVEKNRLRLYKYAPTKYPIRFYFKNESRDVFIDGYVESHEVDHFENGQAAQISIICPQPFFQSVEDSNTEFAALTPLFKFSFFTDSENPIIFSEIEQNSEQNIVNNGDVETGIIIDLRASSVVQNPIIYNRDTGEKFALNITMQEGDAIQINTNSGQKSVMLTRNGVESNIINSAGIDNDWFVLRYGDNIFTYEASQGYEFLQLKITVADKFEGV